ncbi:VanW family protein [Alkalicoccobacillus murimartini]|uniref:Vancomycin resistance protein YoaR n=1 Tax=Alkalicoccobacillus murimartini TaxID=171685 RepID=A0ABT9YDD1_9BACI|nr:VanW family protein [Alkalicoccobacillus murimartini]MDQ0205868.1 vancomycin resistance protein YoaR [Alkalicoccobacillus murimartini]
MGRLSGQVVVLMASFILLTGCYDVGTQSSKPLSKKAERDPILKESMYWDEVELIDHQQHSTVIDLSELGFQKTGLAEELDEATVASFASELAATIDTPMRNPSFDEQGEQIAGENRVILAEEEFIEQIQTLSARTKTLTLPIYQTVPTVTETQLQGIDQYERSSFRTYFDPNVSGRVHNIQLSAEAINHIVLGVGDQFSFNKVVGERTPERGYQEAKEIVNKEFVLGIGGGICQTSSTLFNAIEAAGLDIVHRYTHSREVGYVAEGRDATVSWGGPDFVFQNSLDQPIMIRTEMNHGELVVKILSHTP